jgi:hypothetical protein
MSDDPTLGFGKFVPGFDFLQNLAKGASQSLPQMPSLSNWVAPTLSVEELEKRIGELRAVHFWLEQNSTALGATIQALEVQKMTLSTLKGMNFNMTEMAEALRAKTADAMTAGARKAADTAAGAAEAMSGAAKSARGKAAASQAADGAATKADGAATVVDPLQWWGALTQQFQKIATDALKDAALNRAVDTARNVATGMAREAVKGATGVMGGATSATTSAAAGAKSTAAKKTSTAAKKTRKAPARKRGAADKT